LAQAKKVMLKKSRRMVMAFSRKFFTAAAMGFCLFGGQAYAGGIEVNAPWTRATVAGASVAAGFLVVVNKGTEADRLTGASTDAAQKVEIHEMQMDGDIMKMRALPEGLEIKPGETVTLKPGGVHLMILGLKPRLLPGATLPVTLSFAKAGQIAVVLPVQSVGAMGPAPATEAEPPQVSY
jgi:copper(I)-binding protein